MPQTKIPCIQIEVQRIKIVGRYAVIPLGLEPRAHTLKVYCSTN